MELREALAQISVIRDQIARTETFDGYRSATVASTGVMAIAGAALQSVWIADPVAEIERYLALWIAIAAAGVLATGFEMAIRCRRGASQTSLRLTRMAVEQFLPCLVVGALLTAVIERVAHEAVWMLPGLWSLLFGLGIFSSAPLLPRGVIGVGSYYIAAGLCCLALGRNVAVLSPWSMAATFGVGQFLAAGLLYWSRERKHDPRW